MVILAKVSAISLVDSEIKCRCGFEVDLKSNRRRLWVDNIIEDNGIIDYCDTKGEDKCAEFCRNQVN